MPDVKINSNIGEINFKDFMPKSAASYGINTDPNIDNSDNIETFLNSDNEEIIIPAGVYILSKTVTISRSNMKIKTLGSVEFKMSSSFTTPKTGLLKITGNNVEITNVIFNSNSLNSGWEDAYADRTCLVEVTGDNCKFENSYFYSGAFSSIKGDAAHGLEIVKCKFYGAKYKALLFQNSNYLEIFKNKFYNTGVRYNNKVIDLANVTTVGFTVQLTDCSYFNVDSNIITKTTQHGIYVTGDSTTCAYGKIINNTVQYAGYKDNGSGGNTVTNESGTSIEIIKCSDSVISNNNCYDSRGYHIAVAGECYRINTVFNMCNLAQDPGITLQDSYNCKVSSNVITGCTAGITIGEDANTVQNCDISNNKIIDSTFYDIYIYDPSIDCVVKNNELYHYTGVAWNTTAIGNYSGSGKYRRGIVNVSTKTVSINDNKIVGLYEYPIFNTSLTAKIFNNDLTQTPFYDFPNVQYAVNNIISALNSPQIASGNQRGRVTVLKNFDDAGGDEPLIGAACLKKTSNSATIYDLDTQIDLSTVSPDAFIVAFARVESAFTGYFKINLNSAYNTGVGYTAFTCYVNPWTTVFNNYGKYVVLATRVSSLVQIGSGTLDVKWISVTNSSTNFDAANPLRVDSVLLIEY